MTDRAIALTVPQTTNAFSEDMILDMRLVLRIQVTTGLLLAHSLRS